MIVKDIKINIQDSRIERPIANFVQVASRYASKIGIVSDDKRINAKSIMGMMTLGLENDKDITVTAEGQDEAEAMSAIESFLTSV